MFAHTDQLGRREELPLRSGAALLLAMIGATLATILVVSGFPAAEIAILSAFVIGCAVLWWVPLFECFPPTPRLLLLFLGLRPILDAAVSKDVHRSTMPLQNGFALITAILLLLSGRKLISSLAGEFQSRMLVALLVLAFVAWIVGGLGAGANGFVRTGWGLLVALLLGTSLRTERQISIFIRTLFYSSFLVLAILAFNLKEGEYILDVWRVTGQFGVATTLAEVCFALFLLGLYTFDDSKTRAEKVITAFLLLVLAIAIALTQNRTINGLLILSFFAWLWIQSYRRTFYACVLCVSMAIGIVALNRTLGSESRIASSVSFQQKELSEDVINLTGRTFLWAKTMDEYASASLAHKIIGLGWGTVFANFETFGYELSSVTENSFLWFLVGSGLLGLLAFSAYLGSALRKSWKGWHVVDHEFKRRLSLLAFLVALGLLVEGLTTDVVISPVACSYLYCVLSIFFAHCKHVTLEAGL